MLLIRLYLLNYDSILLRVNVSIHKLQLDEVKSQNIHENISLYITTTALYQKDIYTNSLVTINTHLFITSYRLTYLLQTKFKTQNITIPDVIHNYYLLNNTFLINVRKTTLDI